MENCFALFFLLCTASSLVSSEQLFLHFADKVFLFSAEESHVSLGVFFPLEAKWKFLSHLLFFLRKHPHFPEPFYSASLLGGPNHSSDNLDLFVLGENVNYCSRGTASFAFSHGRSALPGMVGFPRGPLSSPGCMDRYWLGGEVWRAETRCAQPECREMLRLLRSCPSPTSCATCKQITRSLRIAVPSHPRSG